MSLNISTAPASEGQYISRHRRGQLVPEEKPQRWASPGCRGKAGGPSSRGTASSSGCASNCSGMDQHQAPEGFREELPFRLRVHGVAKHAQAVPVHPVSPAAKGTRAPFSPAAAAPDPRLSTLLPGGFPASHELGSAASNCSERPGGGNQ